ncbi:MAG: ATP-dependent zinc protease [Rhizobiales bacterium]|nr:ATP-dependent zinc protease [Hyphomicrobiales bacterium]
MTYPKKVLEIGWREWISLPEIGIGPLKAKIDTGARTSALHAVDLEPFSKDGEDWISFRVPLPGAAGREIRSAPLIAERAIKNTGGTPEIRFIVKTMLEIGKRHWHIEVSLANRQNMEFELIVGRTALREHNVVVHPGRSFLIQTPRPTDAPRRPKKGSGSVRRGTETRPIAALAMMEKKS